TRHVSPDGQTATSSAAFETSIPTVGCSTGAPLRRPDGTRPCDAGSVRPALATVRALAGRTGTGRPCSPTASDSPGLVGLPRPLLVGVPIMHPLATYKGRGRVR